MKHWMKKILAAALALSLLSGNAALASEALGHDLHAAAAVLSQDTAVTRSYFWSDTYNDLRTERYVTYLPNEAVTPTVSYGDVLLSRSTLSAMAQKLEQSGKRVVGGTNGDFYVVATGQPLGLVVTDGILRSSSSYHYAVGFTADGAAFVGTPNLLITAAMLGERVTVFGGVNKIRQVRTAEGGGLTLLTGDFGSATQNTAPGVDVFLRPLTEEEARTVEVPESRKPSETPEPSGGPESAETPESPEPTEITEPVESPKPTESPEPTESPKPSETPNSTESPEPSETPEPTETAQAEELPLSQDLRIGRRTRCVVDYVSEAAGSNPIPEGCFVLTMNAQDDAGTLNMLRSLQPGDVVDIDVTSADPRWSEAKEALGAMYRLLDNGQLGQNLSTERTARTAIGIKADGTVIFYTIDGKQPGVSVGATCAQVAQRLLELGCVEAVGLDGGGSTTLGVTYPDQTAMGVINSPSDGRERANSTAIFLTTGLKPTGTPGDALTVTPGDALLLSGAQTQFSARQLDTAWYDMGPAKDVTYAANLGDVDENGLYTARTAGQDVVSVTTDTGRGEAAVTVVETPDEIEVTNEATGGALGALSMEPGETISLTASALWRNLPLISQDECYLWQCDPEVGTVTDDGTFTAGEKTASGSLTVTAGGRTVILPVNVAGHILKVDDMEGETTVFTSTEQVTAESETDLTHVRTGRRSLRVDYDAGEAGVSALTAQVSIPAGEKYLGLWVYGDSSANSLAAVFTGGEETQTVPVCGLGFSGWNHFLIPIPQGTDTLAELHFIYGGGESRTGTVWLDQMTTSNEDLEDHDAPLIDIKLRGTKVTVSVSDNVDKTFPAGTVKMTYDGWGVELVQDPKTGLITATLPDPGTGDHRLAVTAVDASGNLGRETAEILGDAPDPFADMTDHWASPYAKYLYEQGITTGVAEGDVAYYQPDSNITRAEFFTLAARWMRLDPNDYADVVLPFNDAGDIPGWAEGALKAMYAEGIVLGSQEIDGLYAYPNASVNRSEVMTILGRTQEKGGVLAELDSFTDRADAPEWAVEYVKSLVGQKVINGYEDGTLRPLAPMTRGEAAKVLCVMR